jgi:N-acetylglucosamine kinase
MLIVLGLDGGGTKTECVLMDDTRTVRARSRSGPSNPMRVGFGGALASVCEAAQIAVQNAKLKMADIDAICAGLAGAAQPESEKKMRTLLAEEFPGKLVHVCTDLDLTLEATGTGPAIVLVAGTGSAAVGRGCGGQIARVGGHGYLLGDEGSAYHIGQRAVVDELRAADRGHAQSSLGSRILKELGMADWQSLELAVYRGPDQVFPRVFRVIASAAQEGDQIARGLLEVGAFELAALVADLVERLQLKAHKFLLVKAGGMVGRGDYFEKMLDERLLYVAPHAEFGELAMSQAEAAARMALQLSAKAASEAK